MSASSGSKDTLVDFRTRKKKKQFSSADEIIKARGKYKSKKAVLESQRIKGQRQTEMEDVLTCTHATHNSDVRTEMRC